MGHRTVETKCRDPSGVFGKPTTVTVKRKPLLQKLFQLVPDKIASCHVVCFSAAEMLQYFSKYTGIQAG